MLQEFYIQFSKYCHTADNPKKSIQKATKNKQTPTTAATFHLSVKYKGFINYAGRRQQVTISTLNLFIW